MSDPEIVLLAFSLSLDACAVCLAASAAGYANNAGATFRLSFHFGLFQALMPVAGWVIGTHLESLIAAYDHWIAFGLLTLVGVRMIRSATGTGTIEGPGDPSRGWTLLILAFATSIDALAVGLGLAAVGRSIWYPSAIIGLVTMAMSILAVVGGRRAGTYLGARAQIIGGIVLIIIALKIVITSPA